MVTVNTHKNAVTFGYDVRLLSTDTKPTQGIPNGSVCIEMDTGAGFLFDAENEEWHELPSGGTVVINPARGVDF